MLASAAGGRWKVVEGDEAGRPLVVDVESGRIQGRLEQRSGGQWILLRDQVASRLERFALQAVVRKLLPEGRTVGCLCWRIDRTADVEVWRRCDGDSSHYGNLQTCSLVWLCPVCAAKISERRRLEMAQAVSVHRAVGGDFALVTLTHPHGREDSLRVLLDKEEKAIKRFKGGRQALEVRKQYGLMGCIRAKEITHGINGWHPHFHELWFLPKDYDRRGLQEELRSIWKKACVMSGLDEPDDEHGLTVRNSEYGHHYISKWGLELELTKWHSKNGKGKHRTPFDFLRDYLYQGDRKAGDLFLEYAREIKGQRQLVWSRGLREHFGIAKKSDEEVAAEYKEDAFLLGRIGIEDWWLILKYDLRGEILEAARCGWERVQAVLSMVRGEEK